MPELTGLEANSGARFKKAATEGESFAAHNESILDAWAKMEWQRYWLRFFACGCALVVVAVIGYLEWKVMCRILSADAKLESSLVLLAIVPIASVSLIVVALLIAVFRGSRENDLNRLPLEIASKTAFQD